MNRQSLAAKLEQISNMVTIIDWNMTYDLSKKKFVAIVRFVEKNEP